jgi:hypothetical protein
MAKSRPYNPRKYPFAYLAGGGSVRYDRARPAMGPFFEDIDRRTRLVLRRRGRGQYFAHPPRLIVRPKDSGSSGGPSQASSHSRCIQKVEQLVSRGGAILARPYDGLRSCPIVQLLQATAPSARRCVVDQSLPENRGIRPDVQVRDLRTNRLLMIVEVCCSHPVGAVKRGAFEELGVSCVEISATHGIGSDGIFNAMNLWGPLAPRTYVQASIDGYAAHTGDVNPRRVYLGPPQPRNRRIGRDRRRRTRGLQRPFSSKGSRASY